MRFIVVTDVRNEILMDQQRSETKQRFWVNPFRLYSMNLHSFQRSADRDKYISINFGHTVFVQFFSILRKLRNSSDARARFLVSLFREHTCNPLSTVYVNSEIIGRVLFSRNFAFSKFCENKTLVKWRNHPVVF